MSSDKDWSIDSATMGMWIAIGSGLGVVVS